MYNKHHSLWVGFSSADPVSFDCYEHGDLIYLDIKRFHQEDQHIDLASHNRYILSKEDTNVLVELLKTVSST